LPGSQVTLLKIAMVALEEKSSVRESIELASENAMKKMVVNNKKPKSLRPIFRFSQKVF
jgi:hypothetical protein